MINSEWGILTIIGGWVVVHHLSVIRERQKEIRERKDALIETIYRIESSGIEFHQSSNYSEESARKLLADLSRLTHSLSNLQSIKVESNTVAKFRQSITLKNFDASKFATQTPSSSVVAEITDASERLTMRLDDNYTKRYLSKWWQTFRL